jgi:hypothetical protein
VGTNGSLQGKKEAHEAPVCLQMLASGSVSAHASALECGGLSVDLNSRTTPWRVGSERAMQTRRVFFQLSPSKARKRELGLHIRLATPADAVVRSRGSPPRFDRPVQAATA